MLFVFHDFGKPQELTMSFYLLSGYLITLQYRKHFSLCNFLFEPEQILTAFTTWRKKNPQHSTIDNLLKKLSAAKMEFEYSDFAFLDRDGRYGEFFVCYFTTSFESTKTNFIPTYNPPLCATLNQWRHQKFRFDEGAMFGKRFGTNISGDSALRESSESEVKGPLVGFRGQGPRNLGGFSISPGEKLSNGRPRTERQMLNYEFKQKYTYICMYLSVHFLLRSGGDGGRRAGNGEEKL